MKVKKKCFFFFLRAPRFWTSEAAEEDHEDQHNRLWTELWSAPSLVRQPRCDSSTVPHISDTSLTQPSIPALLEEDMVGVRVSSICLFHLK